ncbi:recombinase family protein [Streptomyces sp. WMMC905]|uniref:recombinase family protein n=1 Tax=Streptomyces sp. WMMC905 TaxID=3404123 RepID=UPI003B9325F7
MKRLGRDAAELTALADHLTAHGLVLEMLAGPLPGIYDPTGPGKLLFAFFAAMAETERENIRESTLEGLDTAARKGKHGGRPPVITDDMLHTVLRRRAGAASAASAPLSRCCRQFVISDEYRPSLRSKAPLACLPKVSYSARIFALYSAEYRRGPDDRGVTCGSGVPWLLMPATAGTPPSPPSTE